MITLLYIFYCNGIYQKIPDMTAKQEREFFESTGNGGLMKLFVLVDILFWVVGFVSFGVWYWKIF